MTDLTCYGVAEASVGEGGDGVMVYRSGGSLFSLQLSPEQTPAAAAAAVAGSEIDVTLLSDRAQMGEHWVNGREWLSWTSVSPDGSRVAMISRGVLFTAPAPVGRNKHRVGARLVQVAPNITNGTQSSFICSLTVVSFCKLNDPFAALSLALSLSLSLAAGYSAELRKEKEDQGIEKLLSLDDTSRIKLSPIEVRSR